MRPGTLRSEAPSANPQARGHGRGVREGRNRRPEPFFPRIAIENQFSQKIRLATGTPQSPKPPLRSGKVLVSLCSTQDDTVLGFALARANKPIQLWKNQPRGRESASFAKPRCAARHSS